MTGFDWIRSPRLLVGAAALAIAGPAAAATTPREIPSEYESTSGLGVALNNAGVAATEPDSAVRTNPALLPTERAYSVSAGYHWPSAGRDFFQAGIVDSKTSSIAAGVSYTGFTDDYRYAQPKMKEQDQQQAKLDSPLVRRGVVGLGQNLGKVSAGAGATYVEANSLEGSDAEEGRRIKGFGLNVGIAMALSPQLRLGASGENLSNRKIADYAPKTYRVGAAYAFAPAVMGYLDARQRDRVAAFEAEPVDPFAEEDDAGKKMERPEQMLIAGMSVKTADFLRLLGSYGQSFSDDRRSLAGGIAVVNKNFSLSYTASRPYMNRSSAHQAIGLSLDMAM
jgi:hypothetical protein